MHLFLSVLQKQTNIYALFYVSPKQDPLDICRLFIEVIVNIPVQNLTVVLVAAAFCCCCCFVLFFVVVVVVVVVVVFVVVFCFCF